MVRSGAAAMLFLEQLLAEVKGALDLMEFAYGVFGFTFELELSTRPENFWGEIETWDRAEKALADALNAFGNPWQINEADGAFYGPKIDITVFDALKRRFQCATIQVSIAISSKWISWSLLIS